MTWEFDAISRKGSEVCRRFREGEGVKELAVAFQLSPQMIRVYLRRNGIVTPCKARRKTAVFEFDICRLYQDGAEQKELSRQFSCTLGTIKKILLRNSIEIRYQAYPEEIKTEAVRRYLLGDYARKIAREMDLDIGSVRNWVRDAGEHFESRSGAPRTYSLNEHAFDEITEESAYWLGFLMADGCVRKNIYQWTITLGLSVVDKEHVLRFRDFIGYSGPVYQARGKPGKGSFANVTDQVRVSVSSVHMAKRLMSFGVVPRKSLIAEVIGLENNSHFWRGMVDGDGFFSHTREGYPVIGLYGSHKSVAQFGRYVKTICTETKANAYKTANISGFKVSARNAVLLTDHLYGNCTVALRRKHDRSKEIMRLFAYLLAPGRKRRRNMNDTPLFQ